MVRTFLFQFAIHHTDADIAQVLAWASSKGMQVEPYTVRADIDPPSITTAPVVTSPFVNAPVVGTPIAPAVVSLPAAPDWLTQVRPAKTARHGRTFTGWDAALRLRWLWNEHVNLPNIWKVQVDGVYYTGAQRGTLIATIKAKLG